MEDSIFQVVLLKEFNRPSSLCFTKNNCFNIAWWGYSDKVILWLYKHQRWDYSVDRTIVFLDWWRNDWGCSIRTIEEWNYTCRLRPMHGNITLYNVCSVLRGMFSTAGDVQYSGGAVNLLSHMHQDIPRSTEHPLMYSWYPLDVLMISPDVLNTHYAV